MLEFAQYRLDPASERLLRGDRVVPMRPKTFAVLSHLVSRPGSLVTRDELLSSVWRTTAVSDDTLTQSITELRRLLRDDPRRPRFIETAHGRGFRFVATVRQAGAVTAPVRPQFVGRATQLRQFESMLEASLRGQRQILLIAGEAGIGKSELVETCLEKLPSHAAAPWIARGQCIQQYGEREPYLPLADALEDLLRGPGAKVARASIRRHAATWAARLPGMTPARAEAAQNVTQARSLRETAVALEEISTANPVVMILEDLHWADPSTLDWLTFVASRAEPARLLIVGTYRSTDARIHDHPITQIALQLASRPGFARMSLPSLDLDELRQYAGSRLGAQCSPALAEWLLRRTGGNSLFAVAVTGQLLQHGLVTGDAMPSQWEAGIPTDLHAVIEQQVRSLTPALRRTLDAAAVVGLQSYTQEIAAALEISDEDAEVACSQLANAHGLIVEIDGEHWPDGSVGSRYGFRHDLYRQWVQEHMPRSTRRSLHARIGRRLEVGFGERAGAPVLAQIAAHYEQGGDGAKALEHLTAAAGRAIATGAFREAKRYLDDALRQLQRIDASIDRDQTELELLRLLAVAEMHTGSYTADALDDVLERAGMLASRLGDDRVLFDMHYAQWFYHIARGDVEATPLAVNRLAALAPGLGTKESLRLAYASGTTAVWSGQLEAAERAFQPLTRRPEREMLHEFAAVTDYGVDPFVGGYLHLAHVACARGAHREALRLRRLGKQLAIRTGRPLSMSAAAVHSALIFQVCGNHAEARESALRARATAEKFGFPLWQSFATGLLGAAKMAAGELDDGAALVREALEGSARGRSGVHGFLYVGWIAACLGSGRIELAQRQLDDAFELTRPTLDRLFEAELWRLRGELLLAGGGSHLSAEEALQTALGIARDQTAWLFALRASLAIASLWQSQGRDSEAVQLLRASLAPIDEAEALPELASARALLGSPARAR